ncbi:MAG: hypothetical protein J6W52_05115 [Bacteroidaceae bacterium]|nr:hypothetical protein [Bacteroidaceae bacterium]
MDIYDLSLTVNACIPIFAPYTPNDEAEHKMEKFLQIFKNDTDSLLNINGSNGWHAGQAFYNTLTYHRTLDEEDKKFCFAGAIISLVKALEMGTMQSVMAINTLIEMIKSNREIVDLYVYAMPDERMVCDLKMPSTLISTSNLQMKEGIKVRLSCILKFLVALQENRLDQADNETKAGKYYLSALFDEAYHRIGGYAYLGIIN